MSRQGMFWIEMALPNGGTIIVSAFTLAGLALMVRTMRLNHHATT